MSTKVVQKFQGEIENYVCNHGDIIESKFNMIFKELRIRTCLTRSRILKNEGYQPLALIFTLFILPFLNIKTVGSLCSQHYHHLIDAKKDTFFRLKNRAFNWFKFYFDLILLLLMKLETGKTSSPEDSVFIVDDTITEKRGKHIENVSYHYDHNSGRSVLGYCQVFLGYFNKKSFFPIDFRFKISNKQSSVTPSMNDVDPRNTLSLHEHEAKHFSKLDLAIVMIQRAWKAGIRARYVLTDSWFTVRSFITDVRSVDENLHFIGRVKNSKQLYLYKEQSYTLGELYKKFRRSLKKDKHMNLKVRKVIVEMNGYGDVAIIFARGYKKPDIQGKESDTKQCEKKWVAFLSTDVDITARELIENYIQRWSIEVFFKEAKQMLGLGKDQCRHFTGQIFATMMSCLRYSVLGFLNQKENYFDTTGTLFEQQSDALKMICYAKRLWDFFMDLIRFAFEKLFELLEIDYSYTDIIDVLDRQIADLFDFQGCET
jgi:hypothetical protein